MPTLNQLQVAQGYFTRHQQGLAKHRQWRYGDTQFMAMAALTTDLHKTSEQLWTVSAASKSSNSFTSNNLFFQQILVL